MLHPGVVRSVHDGERHYIGGAQLARLYGVLPVDEVVTYDPLNPTHTKEYEDRHGMYVIHLHPRRKGDYVNIHARDNEPQPIRPSMLQNKLI